MCVWMCWCAVVVAVVVAVAVAIAVAVVVVAADVVCVLVCVCDTNGLHAQPALHCQCPENRLPIYPNAEQGSELACHPTPWELCL